MEYFKKFNSIDKDYLLTDKHIHSLWSDGQPSLSEIAAKAQEIGLKQIAVVDHVRRDSDYFDRYYEEVQKVNKESKIDMLIGFEAKVINLEGDLDMPSGIGSKADIRVASVHRIPVGAELVSPSQVGKEKCQEMERELSLAALSKGGFNVLGHAGGMSLRYYGEFPVKFFEEIIAACKEKDIALELNSCFHGSVIDELLSLVKKHNVFVSLGSDAHKLEDIGNVTTMVRSKINCGREDINAG